MPQPEIGCPFIQPEIGITSTPVIDVQSGTLFVLARTSEPGPDGKPRYFQRLHALDVATGHERPGSPVLIRATVRSTTTGFLGLLEGDLRFDAYVENPRAALLLVNGMVWIAWAHPAIWVLTMAG